ncbi:MAG TPA: ABC-type transport auxiliary lipoprotein family protein [Burkholderiaceae bacterium]|nr:ABC-type transport auxiliary lipoprotein family protein [Burkholderiaceae bacterium]
MTFGSHGSASALLITAILSACTLFTAPPPEARRGMLTEVPSEVPRSELPASASPTLLILAPRTQRAYDTTQMAYTLRDHEIAYYRDHEWGATPAEMMQPLLVSTLERTHRFAAVLSVPYGGRSTYVLQTQIDELVQDFTLPTVAVRIAMHLQLTNSVSRRAVSKEIVVTEPMAQRSAEAGIAAANRATVKTLREVAQFVIDNAID